MTKPDSYIASSEGHLLAVFRCISIKRLRYANRNDLLLIRIEPSLSGTSHNLPQKNIDKIIIASRHHEKTLFPIQVWQISVYILAPLLDNIDNKEELKEHECKLIAWAEVYPTELAAISHE